jgi:hypothetical protein
LGKLLAVILAVINAVPKLKEFWDQLLVLYFQKEVEKLRKRDVEAIRKAISEKDQRDLEKQVFGKDPNYRSGIDGVRIVDKLPNVTGVQETKASGNTGDDLVK